MLTISVSSAVAQFLAFAENDVAPATLKLYRFYLERFARDHGERALASLTPALVKAWGKTYHRVAAVQRLCSWAKNEALLMERNPLERMKKLPRGRRLRTLTPREIVWILRAVGRECRALLIALRETIARPAELRGACWHHVYAAGLQQWNDADLAGGKCFLFLDSFKAQERRRDRFAVRVIPIPARLGRLLVRRRRHVTGSNGHIFVNCKGKPWTANAVRQIFRRARAAAGLAADHRGENAVAYSMRHTGATNAVTQGVDLGTLAALMGHSDVRMTSRYVHLAPGHLAKALERANGRKSTEPAKNDAPGLRRTNADESRRVNMPPNSKA